MRTRLRELYPAARGSQGLVAKNVPFRTNYPFILEKSPFVPLNGLFCIINGIFRLNGTFYATSPWTRDHATQSSPFRTYEGKQEFCLVTTTRRCTLRGTCQAGRLSQGPHTNEEKLWWWLNTGVSSVLRGGCSWLKDSAHHCKSPSATSPHEGRQFAFKEVW